jgi:hypothetical protein
MATSPGGLCKQRRQLSKQRQFVLSHPENGGGDGLLNAADDGEAFEQWHAQILCSLDYGEDRLPQTQQQAVADRIIDR